MMKIEKRLYGISPHIWSVTLIILLSFSYFLKTQDVEAIHGMVASAHPLASQAGVDILKQGGNAIDAAVATAFVLAVVEPNASGLGGGGFLLIKMEQEEPITIDYREVAPEAATASLYYRSDNSFDSLARRGALSVGVPAVVAGLSLALETYGKLTLSEVLAPAIHYAKNGFTISENLANMIFQNYDIIQKDIAASNIFLDDELPRSGGTHLVNSNLAKSLEMLGREGSEVFYHGELAGELVSTVKNRGGIITEFDFNRYQAQMKPAVKGNYHEYEIYSSTPPAGGTHLIELLNILENYDLRRLQHNSADYLHILAEAMKMVFKDKDKNMADPAFYQVPVEQLTSEKYAAALSKHIDIENAKFDYKSPDWIEREQGNTTHLSVIDKKRNVVALTQSINSWFGSGIMDEENGILLNNHLADFEKEPGMPNSIEPLKRPVSSIAPTILLRDGKPFLTIGTPGGTRIISALAQIIINIIDFDMGIDQAIEAPRIHALNRTLHLEKRINEDVRQELEKRGHKLKVRESFDNYFGGAQGILLDTQEDVLLGGADSRRDGYVVGH
jgi:gamma-glutamyltranspeptidase/glutathione hydrolase